MTDATVLFVKPGAVKPGDKGRLAKAGVIVVEIEDPSAVKMIRAQQELSHGAILAAAAHAIGHTPYSGDVKAYFGAALCAAIEAAHPAKEP